MLYYWHSVGNNVLTTYSNMLTNLNLTDMETCYKAVRGELARSLLPRLTAERFGFEPEITARLARSGARIFEVPISYSGRTYAEGKKIGWRDGVAAFWHITKYNLLVMSARLIALAGGGRRAAGDRVVGDRHRQSVHVRRPIHHREEPGDARPRSTGGGCSLSSYWPPSWGGDGYRPLTILAFKIEYAIGGGRPMRVSRRRTFCSTRSTAVLVFVLARRAPAAMGGLGRRRRCFAVHPVHVEAVANVVGQSELLVAIALLSAIVLYLRDRMAGPLRPAHRGCDRRAVRGRMLRQGARHRAARRFSPPPS